jgi:hypothetical protein
LKCLEYTEVRLCVLEFRECGDFVN